jgi:hypothetical protein
VGLSRPFPDGASVAIARREAQWALSRAVEAGRALVSYGEDRTERWLTGETADLRALVEQVLGAVIDYDAAHGGGLLTSVRVWLEHDRQTERAAQALHIHPNTLLYRVRRFEEISGRPLASTESLAEVWLALRTAAVLELPRPRQPSWCDRSVSDHHGGLPGSLRQGARGLGMQAGRVGDRVQRYPARRNRGERGQGWPAPGISATGAGQPHGGAVGGRCMPRHAARRVEPDCQRLTRPKPHGPAVVGHGQSGGRGLGGRGLTALGPVMALVRAALAGASGEHGGHQHRDRPGQCSHGRRRRWNAHGG